MNTFKPKRYFMTYGLHDKITDIVRGSDGKEHTVTMRGWHWNNLDWIKKNVPTTEEMLVDNSYIGMFEGSRHSLSETLETTIYHYIESFHHSRKEREAKLIKDENNA
ncbi:MAG: hypothetical protein ACRBDI_09890 [Alphaproteobacteria bacterium]